MRESLFKEDWDTLQRQAHTLKGISSSIGAVPLSSAAQELEAASQLNPGSDQIEQLVDALDTLLIPTISNVESYVRQQHADNGELNGKSSLSREELMDKIVALKSALSDYDTDAIEMFDEIADSDQIKEMGAGAISAKITNYDFDEAIELLDVVIEKLNQ